MEGYLETIPKPIKKINPSSRYYVIKHHGFMLLEVYCSCPKLLNTHVIPLVGYFKNTLGSITYLLKLGGVLHNLNKTQKKHNIVIGTHCKHHGLDYFGIGY